MNANSIGFDEIKEIKHKWRQPQKNKQTLKAQKNQRFSDYVKLCDTMTTTMVMMMMMIMAMISSNVSNINPHTQTHTTMEMHAHKQLKYSYHFPFIRLQQMNEK